MMGRLERILNKADNFKESERFEEAIRELIKALKIAPHDPDVYLSFALTYDAMEEFETPVAYFKKALELGPKDCYILTQFGITLGRMGRYSDALTVFEGALTIEPSYVVAKWNLALTLRAIGCYEDALSEFMQCIRTDMDSDYIKSEVHYQIGLCYFDMGWVDETKNKNQEILRSCPDFLPAYNSLALSLAEKGWYDEALDVLRVALECAPEDESIKDSIDYIQSLRDDENGFKGILTYCIINQILKRKHSFKNSR